MKPVHQNLGEQSQAGQPQSQAFRGTGLPTRDLFPTGRETRATSQPSRSVLRDIGPIADKISKSLTEICNLLQWTRVVAVGAPP
jgi:hypothetical protein